MEKKHNYEKSKLLYFLLKPCYACAFNDAKNVAEPSSNNDGGSVSTNPDNYVTFAEFRVLAVNICAYALALDSMREIDSGRGHGSNRADGKLSRKEWLAGYGRVLNHGFAAFSKLSECSESKDALSVAGEMFDFMDLNNNGFVTLAEMFGYLKSVELEENTILGNLFSLGGGGVPDTPMLSAPTSIDIKVFSAQEVDDVTIEVNQKDVFVTDRTAINAVVFRSPAPSYITPKRIFFIDSKFAGPALSGDEGRCKIAVCFFKRSDARATLLYSHGNAEDLGMIQTRLRKLSRALDVNIMAYDYSGYGQSTGKT